MKTFTRHKKQAVPGKNGDDSIELRLEWAPAIEAGTPLVDEHVFLLGRPSMRQYLSFVADLAIDPANEQELAEEWRQASAVVARREVDEAGIADNPSIQPLPKSYAALREALNDDPSFQSFNLVTTEVAMVRLDDLVVYQKHINLEFTKQLRLKLGKNPSDEAIFRSCLPFDHPSPPVRYMRTNSNTFVFLSPSNDIRYLGSMQLKPENIVGVDTPANMVACIALSVGFGSNFFNAIHCENRLILNNGSHRAFALREMGITHAPCIVQHVASREELKAVASSDLRRNPDQYLRGSRPSMMKDYFDPELRKVVPCQRRLRQVRVKYFSDESDLPAV